MRADSKEGHWGGSGGGVISRSLQSHSLLRPRQALAVIGTLTQGVLLPVLSKKQGQSQRWPVPESVPSLQIP